MIRGCLLYSACALWLVAFATADDSRSAPLAPLVRVLAATSDSAVQRDILNGMYEAFQGRKSVTAPAGWSALYPKLAASPDMDIRQKGLVLSVLFDDAGALADLRQAIADRSVEPAWRQFALRTLVDKHPADLHASLLKVIDDPALRTTALRGLAACNDTSTPEVILARYGQFTDAEKADAVATLATRPAFAMALLTAIEQGRIPRRDLSSFTARQLLEMKNAALSAKLTAVWGAVRTASKERTKLLSHYKRVATPDALQKADRGHGRQIFAKTCATCHTLFGDGARIGPELTGSQRANPEYILTKLLDPNAVVALDFQLTLILTKSGRTVTGIVKEENDKTITLQTANELIRLAQSDVDQRSRLPQSMMPEGLLVDRSDEEVRDLLAYLAGSGQVPLPK